MNNSTIYIFSCIIIGIGATMTFDLWTLCLKYVFKIAPSNFCLVGRWVLYMSEGVFRHSNIGSAPRKSAECTVGWIAHYIIGILFAVIFIFFAGYEWLLNPTLIPALIFGAISVLAPFFIMQPSLGFGIAASKASDPTMSRVRSIMNHIVFGIGLYLSGLFVGWSS